MPKSFFGVTSRNEDERRRGENTKEAINSVSHGKSLRRPNLQILRYKPSLVDPTLARRVIAV
ncbi:MAG: hypothetical protein ACON4H_11015 [Rubripirellula sp.]